MTLPAPSAQVCDQKQISWACAHPVCQNVFQPDPSPLRSNVFTASKFSTAKTNFISEDQGKKGIKYFGASYCLCHWIPHPFQQQAHIFPSLPFSTDVLAKALTFHTPCQIQLHMSFGFSKPLLVHANSL